MTFTLTTTTTDGTDLRDLLGSGWMTVALDAPDADTLAALDGYETRLLATFLPDGGPPTGGNARQRRVRRRWEARHGVDVRDLRIEMGKDVITLRGEVVR